MNRVFYWRDEASQILKGGIDYASINRDKERNHFKAVE